MKTIIKSLILLAVILSMTIYESKATENNLEARNSDTAKLDSEFVQLSSIVAPSLARAIDRVSAYIDTVSAPNIIHIPESGQVIEVIFHKMGEGELIKVGYWPVYHKNEIIFLPDSLIKYPVKNEQDTFRYEYMKYYLIYKGKMIAFYNLGDQSKHGDFVDSTKLIKGKPEGYLNDRDIDTLRGEGPFGGLLLEIHSKDSLKMFINHLD